MLMKLYDSTIIRATRHADGTEQGRRLDAYDRPYNQALTQLAAWPDAAILSPVTSGLPIRYLGDLPGDSIDRHATLPRRPGVVVELRNDLIAGEEAQSGWRNDWHRCCSGL